MGGKEEGRIKGDHYVPGLGGWGPYLGDGHREFSFGCVVKSGLKWKQCNRCELLSVFITGIFTATPVGLLRPRRREICIVNYDVLCTQAR